MKEYRDEWLVDVVETRWGKFNVLDENRSDGYETKLKILEIKPNQNISYQYHNHRGENWSVLDGSGTLVLDGIFYELKVGMAVNIPEGVWHSVKAGEKGLVIAEVQAGRECREDDIVRKYYDWNDIVRFAGDED